MVLTLLFAALVGECSAAAPQPLIVGDTRVTALSERLIRVEPKGPSGWEDRTTFNVVNRADGFQGLPLRALNHSAAGSWLAAGDALEIFVPAPSAPQSACAAQPLEHTDAGPYGEGTRRSDTYPNGTHAGSPEACCALCAADENCVAWTAATSGEAEIDCWPFSVAQSTQSKAGRTFGRVKASLSAVKVARGGSVVYDGANTGNASTVQPNMLHWPSPLESPAYAFTDYPRFTVPEWGPTPVPKGATVPPAAVATNGYDFSNSVDGDTYIFLLGDSLDGWYEARKDFLLLTGPTPLLPDFTWGVWYTWYNSYTESRAKDEIGNWTAIKLPLDVWGLDMNWRNVGAGEGSDLPSPASVIACHSQIDMSPTCRSHFYDSPNLRLLPGLGDSNEWFAWLKEKKLRTYFNDHPFPIANQTTPKEVEFRYSGLKKWMSKGLNYWWFDHNWAFTLPGPLMPIGTKDAYEGVTGQVWGSHVYYESTKQAYKELGVTDRPVALTRDNGCGSGWRAPWQHQDPEAQTLCGAGSPAHHRFPVWWTGDGVPLMASVVSMVDEAVHDFRATVHSDCGGHGRCISNATRVPGAPPPSPNENFPCPGGCSSATLLRWTAYCTFGTVMRFHQGDHRFWLRDEGTQDTARSYLDMRYKLAPSLIAAGRTVQTAGYPMTARCDLNWPEHPEARDPTQYLHLNSTLVAPLEGEPETPDGADLSLVSGSPPLAASRSVWIPPGEWTDGWTGATVTGPKTMEVTPTESDGKYNIPIWHKKGALLVAVRDGTQRIGDQDWSELTLEGWPASEAVTEQREVFEQDFSEHGDDASTVVQLSTDGAGKVHIDVSESPEPRAWLVRLHLAPGQTLALDAAAEDVGSVQHLEPRSDCDDAGFFPFAGAGSAPACLAGAIAEFSLPPSGAARRVSATIQ